MGIAIMIDLYALPELAAGTLVEVLPGCFGPPSMLYAVAPVRRHRSPAVRALLDHLIEAFPRRIEELRTRPHVRARGVSRDRG
jgi:DNA-binding transcriptional LysR family regulator